MEEEFKLVRINVHPLLAEELKIRKVNLEKKTGYKINGGMPIVSKICAIELKRLREGNTKQIRLEIHKIKGIKKSKIDFLF